jgi:hypothetical protein
MPDWAPIPDQSSQPVAEPLADPDFRLWRDAPAWRSLMLAAIGISAALVALPLIDKGSGESTKDVVACQTKTVPFAGPARQGQIVGFLSTDQAIGLMQQTQAELRMAINPDYIANVRSLVHLDGSVEGSRYVYVVPQGMNVRIGDRVEVIGGRVDSNLPCHYIPTLITHDLSQ